MGFLEKLAKLVFSLKNCVFFSQDSELLRIFKNWQKKNYTTFGK
jgi:hypothetical protein